MINEEPIWTTLSSEETALLGIALPGALKSRDLKGAYKPGFHGLIIPSMDNPKSRPRPWKIRGLKNVGGMNYLSGDFLAGTSLYELIIEKKFTEDHLALLLYGIKMLRESSETEFSGSFSKLSAVATFFTDKGEMILLPREVLEGILPLQRGLCQLWEEALVNPALRGSENLIFGWSVLAYLYFTGELPFPLEGDEKELPLIRGFFKPLEMIRPELNSKLAVLIHRGLKTPAEVDMTELYALLSRLKTGSGFNEDPGEETLTARKAAAEKLYKRENSRYSGKRFLRRKGTFSLTIAAVVLTIGVVLYTIFSGIFAPPITLGWEQERVVTSFYRAINDLDTEVVDGCETDKAGKRRVDMVSSLYTISRVRMGYEHKNPYINAEEWVSTRPNLEIKAGEQLYGIRELKVKRLSENRFQAEYQEWSSFYSDDMDPSNVTTTPNIIGEWIVEELDLVWKREAWMIGAIRRVKTEQLSSP